MFNPLPQARSSYRSGREPGLFMDDTSGAYVIPAQAGIQKKLHVQITARWRPGGWGRASASPQLQNQLIPLKLYVNQAFAGQD